MDYFRNQQPLALTLLEQFPVVAFIGARQTGKTTLAKSLKPHWHYLDLENPNDYNLLTQDPVLFFNQFPQDVIIDEAQVYPELFPLLRGVIDNDRKRKGRFIITGSSSHELNHRLSESLAGRIATIELSTLKSNEYYGKPLSPFYELFQTKLNTDNIPKGQAPLKLEQMHHLWLKGGYPEPLQQGDHIFWRHWMENYYLNYLNRDIAALFPRMNKIKYQRFIKMLSQLSSTVINRSDLGRALEVNESTVREYLTITEGTFLWRELYSYENSSIKSIIKMPKGYFRDSGLLHFLLDIHTMNDLYTHPIVGHSFEGFVIEEILKGLQASGITHLQARYFRTRKGSEVDLILEGYFGTLPIEIKYSSSTTSKQLKPLREFIEREQLPFGLLINQSNDLMWIEKNILQVPINWL